MDEKNMPLVSVVVPVYNAKCFVAQAIESVLSQTYSNIELILVDDCSNDGSRQVLEEYAKKDERVRLIINEKNKGTAETRNAGIQAAKGQYIALLDGDDTWHKEKIKKQAELLIAEKAEIAYCSFDLVDEDGKRIKSFLVPPITDYQEMLVKCHFSCSTIMVEASLLKAHPFRTEYYHEDYLLWTELLALNVKAVGDPEVLAYYRQLQGSRSHRKINSAIHRWKIYRGALKIPFFKSCMIFVQYAIGGLKKYYL